MSWNNFARYPDHTPSDGTVAIAILAPSFGAVRVFEERKEDSFSTGPEDIGCIVIVKLDSKWHFGVAGNGADIAEIKERAI